MNTKTKRRMTVVTGIIVIVLIVILAVVGGSSSAKSVTFAQAASGEYVDEKIQVTGIVVDNSFETKDSILTFEMYDPDSETAEQLSVRFEGAVSATFGNGVTAICTGKINTEGVLEVSQLVTQCPSKYEDSAEALTVSDLLGYGDEVLDKVVKVAGVVKPGSLVPAGEGDRFVLVDETTGEEIAVLFDDALSEEIQDGSALVLTGSMGADGKFTATVVALQS